MNVNTKQEAAANQIIAFAVDFALQPLQRIVRLRNFFFFQLFISICSWCLRRSALRIAFVRRRRRRRIGFRFLCQIEHARFLLDQHSRLVVFKVHAALVLVFGEKVAARCCSEIAIQSFCACLKMWPPVPAAFAGSFFLTGRDIRGDAAAAE